MIISKTPYRISFFGGGSDYYPWYKKNGGRVLSTTIDKYIYISCRKLPKFFDHKYRIVWSRIENVKKVEKIKHKVVKNLLLHNKINDGLEIVVAPHDVVQVGRQMRVHDAKGGLHSEEMLLRMRFQARKCDERVCPIPGDGLDCSSSSMMCVVCVCGSCPLLCSCMSVFDVCLGLSWFLGRAPARASLSLYLWLSLRYACISVLLFLLDPCPSVFLLAPLFCPRFPGVPTPQPSKNCKQTHTGQQRQRLRVRSAIFWQKADTSRP